jgi:hypothetical protein
MSPEHLEKLRKVVRNNGYYDFKENITAYITVNQEVKAPKKTKKTAGSAPIKKEQIKKIEKITLFGATLCFDKSIKENTLMFRATMPDGTKKHLLEYEIRWTAI